MRTALYVMNNMNKTLVSVFLEIQSKELYEEVNFFFKFAEWLPFESKQRKSYRESPTAMLTLCSPLTRLYLLSVFFFLLARGILQENNENKNYSWEPWFGAASFRCGSALRRKNVAVLAPAPAPTPWLTVYKGQKLII
jgi:hypothetical protein